MSRTLTLAGGDGEAVGVAVESIFRVGAEEVAAEIIESEQAGDFAVAVGDEEEEGVGAEEGVEGLLEGVVIADIIEVGVEDVGDTARVSDVEIVEMGGVDAADQAAIVVFDRKV